MDAIPGQRWCARIKTLCLLKWHRNQEPKESQLFLKWWLVTYIGIQSIAWKSSSGAEHPFSTVKLLSWRENGLQLRRISQWFQINATPRGGEKTVCSLGGINLARIEHPWPWDRSVLSGCFPLHFASTCAPSGNCGWITGARCFAHSDLRVTASLILCSQAGPSSFKNPILAKVEIGQVKSIAYFILP